MKTVKQILEDALTASGKDDLSDHLKTIAVLREKRWTWREIASFLSERGVAVDHTKVYRFAKANEDEINKLADRVLNCV